MYTSTFTIPVIREERPKNVHIHGKVPDLQTQDWQMKNQIKGCHLKDTAEVQVSDSEDWLAGGCA
jgi:hypothetical protein